MSVFDFGDYKEALRQRLKDLRSEGRPLTLTRVAERIGIQNTYLSKVLNQADVHLSEDYLYAFCDVLELEKDEVDHLMLLRARETTANPKRRTEIEQRIMQAERARQTKATLQEYSQSQLNHVMAYLFDPRCVLVHVSLSIPEILSSPRRLCPLLGISESDLSKILRILSNTGFIELSPDGEVLKVLHGRIHYGKDHPLMRSHQSILRHYCATQLGLPREGLRDSFMVTFTADKESFERIKSAFSEFIKSVESLALGAKHQHTFQLNFDLFNWL